MTDAQTRTFGALPPDPGDPDDDDAKLASLEPSAPAGSPLEALRREARRTAEREPITLPVPERPGWSVRYRCNVDLADLARWQKASKDRQMPDGIDVQRLARLVLSHQCIAILFEGKVVEGQNGPLVFASPEFWEYCDVSSAIAAVGHWYGNDGAIVAVLDEVMRASGFDDEALTNPTRG